MNEDFDFHHQAKMQLAGLAVTISLSVIGGLITGALLKIPFFEGTRIQSLFDDNDCWMVSVICVAFVSRKTKRIKQTKNKITPDRSLRYTSMLRTRTVFQCRCSRSAPPVVLKPCRINSSEVSGEKNFARILLSAGSCYFFSLSFLEKFS